MELTASNYFSDKAMREYWSVSQFKQFRDCEAKAVAELNGEYQREATTSLLVGSYVDAYFSGELSEFIEEHPEILKRDGQLKADYVHATEIIERIEEDALFMEFLEGDKQVICTGELFGLPWKCKLDVLGTDKIVDLKVVKDTKPLYKDGFGTIPFIQYWGYDIQGAVYQRIEQQYSGRDEPLPFFLAVATKEKEPEIEIYRIPQHVLDSALKIVENTIERYDLVKQGLVDPIRCGDCDYCRRTKKLRKPKLYDPEEDRL